MRSKLLFIKKVVAILIVLSMNFNTFAAVGANDGSAFVTKAEFDALVNTFNEQMDDYEGSIVSKVDGAIANYLAAQSNEVNVLLTNYYKDINTKYNLYWTSSTTYSSQKDKPTPKLNISLEQASRNSQFQGDIVIADAKNDTLLYGGLDSAETNFVAEEYKKILPTLDGEYKYFYGFFTSATSTTGKGPKKNVSTIYLDHPFGFIFEPNDPGNTSASSTTSWRYITSVYRYSTKADNDTKTFVLAPYSKTKTYVYNYALSGSAYYMTDSSTTIAFNSTKPKWTWTDTRVDTSVQTRSVNQITKTGDTITILNPATCGMPWMHNQYEQNNIKYKMIVEATGEDLPIKNGVKITEVIADGVATINMTPKANGYAIFYVGDKSTAWPNPADKTIPTGFTVSKLLTANTEAEVKLDVSEKDKIWFVFYPQDTTATNVKVDINFINLFSEEM